jgi:hypothetical protein
VQTFMHLGTTWAYLLDPARINEARNNFKEFRRSLSLTESLSRIPRHGFAVGHLPYHHEVVGLITGFKVIFLKRHLRECLVSYMRFAIDTQRGIKGKQWDQEPDKRKAMTLFMSEIAPVMMRDYFEKLTGWLAHPRVAVLSFEDLAACNERAMRQLVQHLQCDAIVDTDLMDKVLSAHTLTKSSGRSRLSDYWSDEAQSIFEKLNGHVLNRELGYQ